jgi:hypothetical protein
MSALLELQRGFAAALLREEDDAVCAVIVDEGFSAAERLRIYRHTCRSTLIATLRMTYPALERLVGSEFFEIAAAQFVSEYPARGAYLNEYGAGFAAFLAAFRPAADLPYLADVARFEWALGIAANAIDAPTLSAAALASVSAARHASLRFEAHPSVSFLLLDHPADEIADAVLSGDDAAMAQVDLASGPVCLVVHRGSDGVQAQRLEPRAHDFLSRLCAGEPFGRLAEAAPAAAPQWLAQALNRGWLCAANR